MMFHLGEDNFIACAQCWPCKALRHKINGLSGAPDKDYLARAGCMYKFPYFFTRALLRLCGALAQRMHRPVHICIIVSIKVT